MAVPTSQPSFLATRRGQLTLALLCAVGFLDFVDTSIVNVALPSIRHDLHFSVQNLQWVLSGYLLTYGGFLLLGGRAADLLGRRRILVSRHLAVRALVHCLWSGTELRDPDRRSPRSGTGRRHDDSRRALDPHDHASTKVPIDSRRSAHGELWPGSRPVSGSFSAACCRADPAGGGSSS